MCILPQVVRLFWRIGTYCLGLTVKQCYENVIKDAEKPTSVEQLLVINVLVAVVVEPCCINFV